MLRILLVNVVCLASAASAAAGVKGTFTNAGVQYKGVDGTAYETKASFGDEPVIRLALSQVPLDAAAIAAALDIRSAIIEKRGDTRYVDLEFAPDGSWRGASYTLASGNGCGWCQDSKA